MSSGKRPSDADDAGGQWVHPLPGPETGAILIAHPMMFTTSQTYFSHAASEELSPAAPFAVYTLLM